MSDSPPAGVIRIECPECGSALRAPATVLGRNVRCPKCRHSWIALDLPDELTGADAVIDTPAEDAPASPAVPAAAGSSVASAAASGSRPQVDAGSRSLEDGPPKVAADLVPGPASQPHGSTAPTLKPPPGKAADAVAHRTREPGRPQPEVPVAAQILPPVPGEPAPAAASSAAGSISGLAAKPAAARTLGSFELTKLLGKGSFGYVFEATDTLLLRTVAVKVLADAVTKDPAKMAAFIQEARAASTVRHKNLVAIYQVGRDKGVIFIAMELVRGGSCADWVRGKGKPMPESQASWVVAEAARGLHAAHRRGIVHRDIKPANIMLAEDGGVKVTDFGLAVKRTKGEAADSGTVAGTPNYMSPEQCRGDAVDARSDLYSLGATYFTLLTGRPPFLSRNTEELLMLHCTAAPPTPRSLRSELPADCDRIVARALAKDPADRYRDAEEMIADLSKVGFG